MLKAYSGLHRMTQRANLEMDPGNSHLGKTSHFLGFLSLLRGRGKNLVKTSKGLQGTQLGHPARPLPWMPSQRRVASAVWRVPPASTATVKPESPPPATEADATESRWREASLAMPCWEEWPSLSWICVDRSALQRGAAHMARLLAGNWSHGCKGCISLFATAGGSRSSVMLRHVPCGWGMEFALSPAPTPHPAPLASGDQVHRKPLVLT